MTAATLLKQAVSRVGAEVLLCARRRLPDTQLLLKCKLCDPISNLFTQQVWVN